MTKNYFLFWLLLYSFSYINAQDYVPMGISSGFNADVIANGTGPVSGSTTRLFDLFTFNLVSNDFLSDPTSPPLSAGLGLPVNGLITAGNNASLSFQLNPYSQLNSLRLTNMGDSGNIVFSNQEQATKLVVLTSSGDAVSGPVLFSVKVHFTDNTYEDFVGLVSDDWHSLSSANPAYVATRARVEASNNVVQISGIEPKLFAVELNLSTANYYKRIAGIEVVKSNSNTGAINLLAVTAKKTPACFEPTNVKITSVDANTVIINWTEPVVTPGVVYEMEIRTSGAPGSGAIGLLTSTTVSNEVKFYTSQPIITYSIYVRSRCTATSFSDWIQAMPSCSSPSVSVANASICNGGSVTLTASTTGGTLRWYDSPTSNTVLGTGTSYTTPILNAGKSYWVDAVTFNPPDHSGGRNALGGTFNDLNTFINWGIVFDLADDVYLKSTDVYVSASGTINIAIVNSAGTELFATGDVAVTALGGAVTPVTIPLNFQLGAGTGYRMMLKNFTGAKLYRDENVVYPYIDPSGTMSINSGYLGGYTSYYYYYFYNIIFEKGCKSPRKEVVATINNTASPTATDQAFCIAENKTIDDLAITGTDIKWYAASTGGSSLSTSDILTTKTYYATQTLDGCESVNRTPVQVTIYDTAVPTATDQAFCIAENKTIGDLIATGSVINWYDTSTGGSALLTSDVLTTKTYYATQTLDGCESVNRTAVQVTIYDTAVPTASDQAFCIAENKTIGDLIATGSLIKWYDASTGGSSLLTSDVLTTKTYYATQTLNGCESVNRTPVQVTIYDTPVATATDQAFCIAENKTIGDLIATGSLIKWYDASTGGSSLLTSDVLTTKTYYATQTLNGCESVNRTPVQVTIYDTAVPMVSDQAFCIAENKTIGDLAVTGTDIKWYAASTGGSVLSTSDVLTNNIYYATQTLNGCESVNRTAVQVTIYDTAVPTAIDQAFCVAENKTIGDLAVTGTNINWYAASTGGSVLSTSDVLTNNTYYATQTLNGCESVNRTPVQVTIYDTAVPTATDQAFCIAENKTIDDLAVMGTNINWYAASTGGSVLSTSDVLTNNTYYATQTLNGCESVNRTPVQVTIYDTPVPAATDQAFCIAENKTIGDLIATGSLIKWYDASTGGSSLLTSDVLTTKTYYATQTLNGCESVNRTPVQVTIYDTPVPAATDQAFCIAENKTIGDLIATGSLIKWYDASTGGSSLLTSDVLTTKTYYATQTLNGCESVNRTPVQVTIYDTPVATATDQAFCIAENKTIGDLIATGSLIKWYDASTGGSSLLTSDVLTTKTYYATQTLDGCESVNRTPVQVTIYDTAVPTATDQAFCIAENKTIGDLIATGSLVKWYDTPTGGSSLPTSDVLISKTYYATQTLNGCESVNRAPVQVTIYDNTIQIAVNQEFCAVENKTVGDLETMGTMVKWYANATATNELSAIARLNTGIYYAVMQSGHCYSNRIAVNVEIKDAAVPTGQAIQYLCGERINTILDLQTDQEEVLWYESATGGSPLNPLTVLESMQKYYASYVGQECESSKRLEVQAIIRNCDVVVHNGISANGDGKNDYFGIEGVTAFPDNKLEIFNSWGSLVYETTRYGYDDNLFKGFANKGLGKGKGLLPFGTYYYVFSFTNHDSKRITKTGFLHLNP